MVREILRQDQAFMDGGSGNQYEFQQHRRRSQVPSGPKSQGHERSCCKPCALRRIKLGAGEGVNTSKTGKPYLPAGVPRNPRHGKAIAGWSSGPKSAVGVISVTFWPAFFSKLDNDAVVRLSALFHHGVV